jgi:Holliday junction resolvase RusA-like endonuclease
MSNWTLSLPPTANHMYANNGRGGRIKTDLLRQWEGETALQVAGWEPRPHASLAVQIELFLPKALMRRADIDGYLKPLLDQTVGKRRDCWVDWLTVRKTLADVGSAYVQVNEVEGRE